MPVRSTFENGHLKVTASGKFNHSDMVDFANSYYDIPKSSSVTVDMTGVTHIDSSTLGLLITLRKWMGEQAAINLIVASESVYKVLKIGNFDKMFVIEKKF